MNIITLKTVDQNSFYTLDNYQIPLYKLKLKYPQNECSAYQCLVCNKVHIGKI